MKKLISNIKWFMKHDIRNLDFVNKEFKIPEPSLEDMIKVHNEFWERHKWVFKK